MYGELENGTFGESWAECDGDFPAGESRESPTTDKSYYIQV